MRRPETTQRTPRNRAQGPGALCRQGSFAGVATDAPSASWVVLRDVSEFRVMQSLESRAESGSILNTHVLTDADGKQYEGKGPALDESFLKSVTRNFTFSAYIRAGVQFNGSGGGGNFNFEPPDNEGGRPRLGNENDTYMELTWQQAHMLGDSPDVMDVSMRFTPAIRYVQNRGTFITGVGGGQNGRENGSDFDFVLREAYLAMANVFKSAPEITFWAGQRFYDRFNIDPMDYYWLDMSGYGAGVENIDLGIGKLWVAYLGGLDDDIASPDTGSFYKHSLDVRLKDIAIGPGKLMLVGIANYEKGTTFKTDFNGNPLTVTNPVTGVSHDVGVRTSADSVLRLMPIPGLTMGGCLGPKWSGISSNSASRARAVRRLVNVAFYFPVQPMPDGEIFFGETSATPGNTDAIPFAVKYNPSRGGRVALVPPKTLAQKEATHSPSSGGPSGR